MYSFNGFILNTWLLDHVVSMAVSWRHGPQTLYFQLGPGSVHEVGSPSMELSHKYGMNFHGDFRGWYWKRHLCVLVTQEWTVGFNRDQHRNTSVCWGDMGWSETGQSVVTCAWGWPGRGGCCVAGRGVQYRGESGRCKHMLLTAWLPRHAVNASPLPSLPLPAGRAESPLVHSPRQSSLQRRPTYTQPPRLDQRLDQRPVWGA